MNGHYHGGLGIGSGICLDRIRSERFFHSLATKSVSKDLLLFVVVIFFFF